MIDKPYVLFTRIPLVIDQANRIFCDPLWAKDLRLHLGYISEFKICCPVLRSNNTQGLEDITDDGIKFIYELRQDHGLGSVIRNLLPNFLGVIKACKGASIVHSGGSGWAFPLSFYLLLVKPFFSFQWVMVIESSFWMLEQHEKPTLRKLIAHYTHKIGLSWCLKTADARIFTQSFYRKYFLGEETARTLIAPATWVDENNISTSEDVKQRFLSRAGKPLEVIFPARLVEEKGVFILFDAVNHLKDMNSHVVVTILGTGALENECRNFSSDTFRTVKVIYHNPVAYGESFFKILRNYDVVLIPNLKQEQPRIVFDAFSQGIGVIASNTSGILDITNNDNAIHFKTGDSRGLAKAIDDIAKKPDMALKMGLHGLSYVKGKTHSQMHLDRKLFLEHVLNS